MKSFKKLTGTKWLVLAVAIIALVVFDALSPRISIAARSIAVGLGVDLTDDGALELSAQIAMPPDGNDERSFQVFSARGRTVGEAIAALDRLAGTNTGFAHAQILVLGQDFLASDNAAHMRYFIESDIVSDNITLVAAKSAKDMLLTMPAMGENASYQLTKQLTTEKKNLGENASTLKQYFMHRHYVGGATYLPVATTMPAPPATPETEGAEDTVYYELTAALALKNSQYVLRLSTQESLGLSLVTQQPSAGTFIAEIDGTRYGLALTATKSAGKADAEKNEYKLEIEVSLRDEYIMSGQGIPDLERLSAEIRDTIVAAVESCYRVCAESGVDIFAVGELMYRSGGSKWLNAHPDYLKEISPKITASVRFV